MKCKITLVTFLIISVLSVCNFAQIGVLEAKSTTTITEKPKRLKQIILTMGSWRKPDVEQVNVILQKFTEKYPHIVIKFDPTAPADYNDVIEAQLESGTAPDLFYLRSF